MEPDRSPIRITQQTQTPADKKLLNPTQNVSTIVGESERLTKHLEMLKERQSQVQDDLAFKFKKQDKMHLVSMIQQSNQQ